MRQVVPALALLVLSASCTLNTDYFTEYRGVNLLGNYDFDALKSDGVTPKWSLATSTDFMVWAPVVDADRPTEAVYRLEIKNLIPNGDFEDAAVTPDAAPSALPSGWTTTFWTGAAPTSPAVINFGASPSNTIHKGTVNGSRALGWDSGGTGNQLRVALRSQVVATAWLPIGYLFRVELINVGTGAAVGMTLYGDTGNTVPPDTMFNAPDWTVNTVKSDNTTDNTSVYSVVRPFLLEDSADDRYVAFGPNSATGTNAAVLDNVRLLPRSESLVVSASFDTLASGVKPLLPGSKVGMYIFTVDVKDDPAAGSLNHFQPKVFTILVQTSEKNGVKTYSPQPEISRPAGGWPTWTTITLSFGSDFVNRDSDLVGPALKISLSPTVSNTGDVDVGTILVSRPKLTFNP